MAQVTITQLPQAGSLTGDELVPIVQNGVTVHTTTGAIAAEPTQTQSFLTVNQETTLPNSRRVTVGTGLDTTDGGAQGALNIFMTGAAASLNAAGTGFMVKSDSNTLVPREITVAIGLLISNGNGVSANPTISLDSFLANFQSLSGSTGLVGVNGGLVSSLSIAGVANQISVINADGSAGNPTVGLASNPVIPGSAGTVLPSGNTASRPPGASNGTLRYNTDLALFEGYANNTWGTIATGGGVTSVGTGTGLTGGPITSTGTISIADTTVVAGDYTAANISVNAQGQITAASSNSSLVSSFSAGSTGLTPATATTGAVTLAGTLNVANGGTGATTLTGYVKGSGTSAMTASSTIPTTDLSGTISNAQLANSSLTLGTTTVSLGGTSTTLGGLTSVTLTQDPTADLQAATKQYVDSVAQGLNVKSAVLWATTGDITLSGLSTQAGGEWTGSLTAGDRILVKNQSTSANNGIYAAAAGSWTRTTDANTWDELVSAFVFVQDGATLGDTGWVCTVNPGGTLGVTAVTWAQFSGAGTYTAGTGLTLTGTQFSLTAPVTAALGGTGFTSYSTGDMLYASGSTAISKLTLGTTNYVLTAGASAPQYVAQSTLSVGSATTATNVAGGTAGAVPYQTGSGATSFLSLGTTNYVLTAGASAPQYVAQSTLSVGSATNATNATNTGITADSTNATNYLTFVSTTSGNLPQLVNSSITCNPSTGSLTGGIKGGAF